MFRRFPVLVTCLVLLLAPAPAFAQGGAPPAGSPEVPKWRGNVTIKGAVKDETGHPVADAKLTFVLSEVGSGFTLRTGALGEFEAKGLKAGEWKMQVDVPNFIVLRQVVLVAAKDNAPIAAVITRDNTPELLAAADALFREGKNAEARVGYLAVLARHPELTAINRGIAFTYGREKNHPEALKYLDLALAASPADATLLLLASASAMEIDDIARAMSYLGRIDDATLTDPDGLLNTALNLLNRKRPAEATKVLNRVVTRFPDAPDAYFYRAHASLTTDQVASAKADLEKYLSIAPPTAPMLAQAKDLLAKIK